MRLTAAMILFAMLRACTPVPTPAEPEPTPEPPRDSGTSDVLLAPCESSCNAYRSFGCPEGEPTKKGHVCEEVCRNAAASGIDLSGSVGCTQAARNCGEVRSCSK